MNKNPLVSVIIPVYNAEKTITESIDSVINQTFTDFELIIINDGSTDGTEQILNNLNDQRFRIIKIKNSGPSAARNRGIESAKGNYISFIDSDDLWTRDKLEKQYNKLLSHPECDVAYSWTIFIDQHGRYIHPFKPVKYEGDVYEKMLVNNFVGSGSNILVKKTSLDSVGYFNTELNYAEEWDLLIRLSKKFKFTVVEEYQIFYRQTAVSLTSSIEELEKDSIKVIDNAYKNAPRELPRLKNKTLSSLNSYLSYLYLTRQPGENWKARSLSKAIESIGSGASFTLNIKGLLSICFIIVFYFLPSKYFKSSTSFCLKLYGMISIYTDKGMKSRMQKNNLLV